MRARLGRDVLYMPSCRLGLYVALRHWCPPGGRVLMSPVNDDVIFFVVLAAGLRPVQAPLNPYDGSIDLGAVPESVWGGLSGVITTNLYGNPDPAPELRSRCDTLGIPLIEDCAHAIGSTVAGRPVGSFGDAAVFSLSKHVGAKTGGFLAFGGPKQQPDVRDSLVRLRDLALLPARPSAELAYAVRPYAEAAVRATRLVPAARAALRLLGQEERDGIRMPLRADELARAVAAAPDLAAFHSWVRVDMHDYRLRPGRLRLRRTERLLGALDATLDAHRAGTEALLGSPWAPPSSGPVQGGPVQGGPVQGGPVQPLFRFPLLVADRAAAVAALARRHITTGYLYDPPLDSYAGAAFTDPPPSPAPGTSAGAWFARHALPVDPRLADRVISVLREADVVPVRPVESGADNGTSSRAGSGTGTGG
ncbi:DegT/DnrJ/EryC1/StrS family aminotransferase [Streptomyces paludis]|uniref:DegT/DnrJ/EryC1/StrS aminotransferase family protein n=1 Tax=Streptomyces paludis TaxID=2282738 RepID=A0A345I0Q1_9ACTN|nr:DegT/DnrJ/EryC1/StrS family aminotransferase [Streptomyces paludis]AXG82525.1 DegT/DnrJ/EryC1/StrS aminotransferase family protein [Streptomyces paludis]